MTARPTRSAALLGVALLAALSPAAASAAHSTSDAAGTPAPTSNALLLRSQALNAQLHLGGSGGIGTAMQAVLVRSEGLNTRLGLGASTNVDLRSPDTRDAAAPVQRAIAIPAISTASSQGFDWTAAGIGALAAAAAGTLALSAAAVTRRKPAGLWS